VARLGGDEFVVVLPDMADPSDTEKVAMKILAVLSEPFVLGGGEVIVRIGASIGIAHFPPHGMNAEELLDAADQAMYQAKQAGKGCFLFAGDAFKADAG
jgi:diguanylate cyclase (GGDEF)-like protein